MDRLKIVVADDERDTREYLQEYLSFLGHDVRAVGDGRQLMDVCREFAPDLIITDYAMPGVNGWTAAQEINRNQRVPVILFSGRDDLKALTTAAGSPVIKVLTKPLKEAELREVIELAKQALR